ncbi:multidrug resistance protein MdtO [Granulicella rosea]|uniref:Multidrug resistance protein MdtO n=2 Tax=Granulicella rosea TaxID=474952 RepID=A0A239GVZ9_9BACT|nr:multidrug resistance protein MdtO [Granulicella rosea]
MATERAPRKTLGDALWGELAPFPGRLAGSLRDTLSIVVALVLAETLRVNGISLALALIFLLQREHPGLTLRSALQLLGGAVVALGLALVWVQFTDGVEVARFLGVAIGVFCAAFGMAATRYPLFFTIFGFYGFLDLSLWDTHRSPTAVVNASLQNVASLALVLGVSVAMEYVFASRHPAEELSEQLSKRLRLLHDFYTAMAEPVHDLTLLKSLHARIVQYAHAGDLRMNQLYEELQGNTPAGLRFRIGLLTRVLEQSALVGYRKAVPTESEREALAAIAAACASTPHEALTTLPASASTRLREIQGALRQYAVTTALPASMVDDGHWQGQPSSSFFLQDAFTAPQALYYSLKLTLSAMVCYLIYNAIAWPGIITCVVTVLFTGLSSTGAMKQKQLYRLTGAAIGGAIAIATESFLFPNMDSIATLALVVAAVTLLAAWVMRSPHAGYTGIQIGFGFFITALQGFSAATQIAPARDRVIGVALGIVVMWFVFDQLWPTRSSDVLRQILARTQAATERLRGQAASLEGVRPESLAGWRAGVSADLGNMQTMGAASYFDFGRARLRELARTRRLTREIEASAAAFYLAVEQARTESLESERSRPSTAH